MDILHKIRRDRKDVPIGVDPNLGISHFLLLRLQLMPYLLRQLPDIRLLHLQHRIQGRKRIIKAHRLPGITKF